MHQNIQAAKGSFIMLRVCNTASVWYYDSGRSGFDQRSKFESEEPGLDRVSTDSIR